MFGILTCFWWCFGAQEAEEPKPQISSPPNPVVTQTYDHDERNGSFDTVDLNRYEEFAGVQRKRSGENEEK